MLTWRGRLMRPEASSIISFHCAIQPTVLATCRVHNTSLRACCAASSDWDYLSSMKHHIAPSEAACSQLTSCSARPAAGQLHM